MTAETTAARLIAKPELDRCIRLLIDEGYQVVGPRVEESAIVYADVQQLADLPRGYRDVQAPGKYRVEQTGSEQYFEFNVGPHSWKQFLFPPRAVVATGVLNEHGWTFDSSPGPQPKYALLGVRGCELAAIRVQDRVFMQGAFVDPIYAERRQSALIIAVNCTVAAATCFCTSMDTGPRCTSGYDLALTELEDGFVVEVGSTRGAQLLEKLASQEVTEETWRAARAKQQRAVEQISKQFDSSDLRDLLLGNLDHPHWDDVAARCLSCTNCTMVCPTCFCSSVAEVADLSGERVARERSWDSCFNIDLSYTAGGVVRDDRRSRFRQWLTHKLASWHDQFDSSGCVGCGRCITWCPVGIDLTEEVAQIRDQPAVQRQLPVVEPAKTACTVPPKDN